MASTDQIASVGARKTMSSETEPIVETANKSVALHINKKRYAKPHLNYFGKITEVTASGSGEKMENDNPGVTSRKKKP